MVIQSAVTLFEEKQNKKRTIKSSNKKLKYNEQKQTSNKPMQVEIIYYYYNHTCKPYKGLRVMRKDNKLKGLS